VATVFALATCCALLVLVTVLSFPQLTERVARAVGVATAVVLVAGYLLLPVVLIAGALAAAFTEGPTP
jgi:hypothetical protein